MVEKLILKWIDFESIETPYLFYFVNYESFFTSLTRFSFPPQWKSIENSPLLCGSCYRRFWNSLTKGQNLRKPSVIKIRAAYQRLRDFSFFLFFPFFCASYDYYVNLINQTERVEFLKRSVNTFARLKIFIDKFLFVQLFDIWIAFILVTYANWSISLRKICS